MDILQAMDQLQVCYRYATATYGIYRPTAPYGFRGKSPEFADEVRQGHPRPHPVTTLYQESNRVSKGGTS